MGIPHLLHMIWIQGEEHLHKRVPHARLVMDAWRRHLPTHTLKLWDKKQLDPVVRRQLGPKMHAIFNKAGLPFAFVADIGRWAVLMEQGGVYSDMDAKPIKDTTHLFQGDVGFMTPSPNLPAAVRMLWHGKKWRNLVYCNHIMASTPGHPAWHTMLAEANKMFANGWKNNMKGPFMMLIDRAMETHAADPDVRVLSASQVLPSYETITRHTIMEDEASLRRKFPMALIVHPRDVEGHQKWATFAGDVVVRCHVWMQDYFPFVIVGFVLLSVMLLCIKRRKCLIR